MYKTMNNWLCKEIVYSCCRGDYDVAVILFFDNVDDLSDDLFLNMFDFVWNRCDFKSYHDVLKRLRNKSVEEFQSLYRLTSLILRYKRKGGVLKK